MTTVFAMTSQGLLTISATLPISTPSIDIGPASLDFMIGVTLNGTFDVTGTTVQWVSASATLSVAANLSASVPIYGFSILGISVGFYLDVTVSAAFALTLILAPTQAGGTDLIPGIGIEVQKLLGVFTLALSASVDFGIGIASIGLGAGISVALAMTLSPSFSIGAGWVNGSIFATASFLFWSDSWNIVSGTIYSWDPPSPLAALRPGDGSAVYNNNGTGTTWGPHARYYAGPGYDALVWDPTTSQGPAISDIYPYTEVSAASTSSGSYLFYTSDNTTDPVESGLGLSELALNASTNGARGIPAPADPGYLIAAPEATTLSDGTVYVAWDALPVAEASDPSPLDLASLALQGALYYPNTSSWGPVTTFSQAGFAESYQVDADGNGGSVLALVSSSPLIGSTTTERLVEYNLTDGALEANTSATGLSEVVSLRASAGEAIVETVGGNYSLLTVASGTVSPITDAAPTGTHLVSAEFASGSASTLVLVYRGNSTAELVLYDLANGQAIATMPVSTDATEAEAIAGASTTYVFVRSSAGLEGWSETAGSFTNLTNVTLAGVSGFGLAQSGGAILVYALARTGGNATDPIDSLFLTEIGSTLPMAPGPSPSTPRPSTPTPTHATTSPDYALYLGLGAIAVLLLLAVLALLVRKKGPGPTPPAATSPPPGAAPTPPSSTPPTS